MPQFIYTMKDLRKATPQGKDILKGIWLSFFYGAKIGVIGHNGAGKSTLLRIMAGLDDAFAGEAFLGEGYSVGLVAQEPVLDPAKNVLQHVEESVAEPRALLRRFEAVSAKLGEPMSDDEMEKCLADIFGLEPVGDPFASAVQETQLAIEKVLRGERSAVELSPQEAFVRRRQHEMARAANLISHSRGKEPYRRVRILQNQ